jgi:FMN phosphatase YigB (HAD superfamily)
MSIRALILDYGEVLSLPQPPTRSRHGGSSAGGGAAVRRRVLALSRRLRSRDAATEYWQSVLADAHAACRQADEIPAAHRAGSPVVDRLSRRGLDARGAAAAAGVRTAVLSNGVPEIMEVIERERAISTKFDTVVVSYEVGCAKPTPRSSS